MKKIFALILFIWGINTIQALVVMNCDSWIFKIITVQQLHEEEKNSPYSFYRFMRDVSEDNDCQINYYIYDDNVRSVVNGTTRFCQANTSTLAGTVSAVTAGALGVTVADDTPCPITAGTHTFQSNNFTIEGANVEGILDDSLYVTLFLAVQFEDWGFHCFLFPNENGAADKDQ